MSENIIQKSTDDKIDDLIFDLEEEIEYGYCFCNRAVVHEKITLFINSLEFGKDIH